jgi:hypothetical protein
MLSAVALGLKLILARIHVAAQADDCLSFAGWYFWKDDCLVAETCVLLSRWCVRYCMREVCRFRVARWYTFAVMRSLGGSRTDICSRHHASETCRPIHTRPSSRRP